MTTSIRNVRRRVEGPESRVPSRGRVRGPRGFTLLELILVMGIIFVLASVVIPRFSDFLPSLRVRKTGDRIMGWAQKARSDAAVTGTIRRLVFDTQEKSYWIEYEASPFRDPGVFTSLGGAWEAEPIPDGVELPTLDGLETDPAHSARRFLEFRPDGTTEDATIVVANDRDDRVTIKVVGATSRIYVDSSTADGNAPAGNP